MKESTLKRLVAAKIEFKGFSFENVMKCEKIRIGYMSSDFKEHPLS
jgi:predicted O-linked N-acetylglucosamine transferase (SPINDLY family)